MSLHWEKIIEDEQTVIMTKCLLTNTLVLIVSIHNCSAVFLGPSYWFIKILTQPQVRQVCKLSC